MIYFLLYFVILIQCNFWIFRLNYVVLLDALVIEELFLFFVLKWLFKPYWSDSVMEEITWNHCFHGFWGLVFKIHSFQMHIWLKLKQRIMKTKNIRTKIKQQLLLLYIILILWIGLYENVVNHSLCGIKFVDLSVDSVWWHLFQGTFI